MPRSLVFCAQELDRTLGYLAEHYNKSQPCDEGAHALLTRLKSVDMDEIFETGLHDFLQDIILQNNSLSAMVATDYNFD